MIVIFDPDTAGETLKDIIKEYLPADDYDVNDVTDVTEDFVGNTPTVAMDISAAGDNSDIMIDVYGAGSFVIVTKIKGMVAAEVSDGRSTYMIRAHNNVRMITTSAEIVGVELAKNITKGFLEGHYDGDRHQIRVDMLNKMC